MVPLDKGERGRRWAARTARYAQHDELRMARRVAADAARLGSALGCAALCDLARLIKVRYDGRPSERLTGESLQVHASGVIKGHDRAVAEVARLCREPWEAPGEDDVPGSPL